MHTFHHFPPCPFTPEQLLGRDPIILDPENVRQVISRQTVLVTGAAGFIGGELAIQLCRYQPARLILIDQSETALNDLEILLENRFPQTEINAHLADITDTLRMSEIFSRQSIHILFHAAAYKHVPFMEKHPYEAIKTNILGTEVLADLAIAYQVGRFVYISTDKALKPASVMGATKRFGELYLQHLSREYPGHTRFIITRFGNVLGSNGSFMVRFASQIRRGGPVTITHPEVNRFMMTITEACLLLLEAAATGNGGEIMSFDMGQPVRIADLAVRMIALAGLQPGIDIQFEFTGLRAGEKLSEEPLTRNGSDFGGHGKIITAQFPGKPDVCMRYALSALQEAMDSGQPERMVAVLKTAIPEYISINSHFSKLDAMHQNEPG